MSEVYTLLYSINLLCTYHIEESMLLLICRIKDRKREGDGAVPIRGVLIFGRQTFEIGVGEFVGLKVSDSMNEICRWWR